MAAHRTKTAIRDELRRRISREYVPGQRLPSEQELALELEVSRNTIREVLEELRTMGLVLRRWGTGTFVNPAATLLETSLAELSPIPERVRREGRRCEVVDVSVTTVLVPETVAVDLELAPDAQVHSLSRVYVVDGVRAVFVKDWLPLEIEGVRVDVGQFVEDLPSLLQRQGAALHHALATIEAVSAPTDVVERLGLQGAEPILRSRQVGFSAAGRPIVFTAAFQRTDVLATRIVRYSRA